MKRKIGLLTAVLFALTLTSQTILALDHDPFDPKYNGSAEIVANSDSDPWIDAENMGTEYELFKDNNVWIIIIQLHFAKYLGINIEIEKRIIIKNNNTEIDGENNNSNIIDNIDETDSSKPKKD